jgi:serine/threonine protein phosphatase PrpC
MFSGTTCVQCYVSQNAIVCANSGDSRALLCSVNPDNGQWYCTPLSRDHKPEEVDEAARIRRSNGKIEQSRLQPGVYAPGLRAGMFYGPKRVWLKSKPVPGLAMTRSIGDMAASSVGVTAEPEIMVFDKLTKNDKILVIASDGIWDRFSNEEIMMTIATQFYQ